MLVARVRFQTTSRAWPSRAFLEMVLVIFSCLDSSLSRYFIAWRLPAAISAAVKPFSRVEGSLSTMETRTTSVSAYCWVSSATAAFSLVGSLMLSTFSQVMPLFSPRVATVLLPAAQEGVTRLSVITRARSTAIARFRVCACFICVLSLSPVCTGKVGCLYSSGRRDALSAGPSHTAYGYYTISLRILQRKCRSFSCKIDRNFDKHKNRQFVCDIATYCDFLHKSRFMYKPSWSF